jgi:hypothetical protein
MAHPEHIGLHLRHEVNHLFTDQVLQQNNIPNADYKSFRDYAEHYIKREHIAQKNVHGVMDMIIQTYKTQKKIS